MVRRTKRSEAMTSIDQNIHLTHIEAFRNQCIARMTTIKPFCDDYKALREAMEFLDMHQELWTGDPNYFHIKPAPIAAAIGSSIK